VNFSRALTYSFEDRDWIIKLGVTAIVTVLALALSIVVVGLGLWALLLGYQAALIHNIRLGLPRPLPTWGNLGRLFSSGLNILGGTLIYNLPNALLFGCVAAMSPSFSQNFTGTAVSLGLACCVLPIALVYNAVAQPMQALAVAKYGDRRQFSVFFEFGSLFAAVRRNAELSLQFLLWSIVANMLFALLLGIPALFLAVPVHGYLAGEYAAQVLGRPRTQHRAQQRPPVPSMSHR
jgi:hypothetical protein